MHVPIAEAYSDVNGIPIAAKYFNCMSLESRVGRNGKPISKCSPITYYSVSLVDWGDFTKKPIYFFIFLERSLRGKRSGLSKVATELCIGLHKVIPWHQWWLMQRLRDDRFIITSVQPDHFSGQWEKISSTDIASLMWHHCPQVKCHSTSSNTSFSLQ